MNIIQVSQPVLNAVRMLLSDDQAGFNVTMQAVAAQLDLDTGTSDPDLDNLKQGPQTVVPNMSFDFSANSNNFYQTWLQPEVLTYLPTARFPILSLYTTGSRSTHEQISSNFSGPVDIGLDVHLAWPKDTWPKSLVIQDTEKTCAAIESTIYTMFQPEVGIPYLQQIISLLRFSGPEVKRTPLQLANQHWLQSIRTQMTIEFVG
jgi:hypothetical protein